MKPLFKTNAWGGVDASQGDKLRKKRPKNKASLKEPNRQKDRPPHQKSKKDQEKRQKRPRWMNCMKKGIQGRSWEETFPLFRLNEERGLVKAWGINKTNS